MSLLLLLQSSGPATGTETWTADVAITATATTTWTGDVSVVGTRLRRILSGKVTYDECSSVSKFDSVATGPTVSGGMARLQQTTTVDAAFVRGVNDMTGLSSPFYLRARDIAVSVDVYWTGANTATAGQIGVWQDANNEYFLSVGKGSGGTSTLYSTKAGVKTARATIATGAVDSTLTRVKFYREGDTLGGSVNGTDFTEWTDSSSPLNPSGGMAVMFGGPTTGSGTADNRFDNLDISLGNTIRVCGVPTGGSARIYDTGGTVLAQGLASSNVVSLDCSEVTFPFAGYVRVFSDGASYSTQVTDGYLPASDFRGGDEIAYDASFQTISVNGVALYGTSQYNTHNGVITSGNDVYGAFIGWDNRVIAWHGNFSSKQYTEYEVEGAYTAILDQHDPLSIVQDSAGYFHMVYGGSGVAVKYRKSTSPNSVASWGAATNVIASTAGSEVSLVIDQADVLYCVGLTTSTVYLDQVFCCKNTGAGWGAAQVIANASGNYRFLFGDLAIGKETSGQQTIHFVWSGYDNVNSYPTGYKNVYYARSTNAAANWKGLTGSNYTLPLSMTAGDLTAADHVYTGLGSYVDVIGVDPDNTTLHLVSVVPSGSTPEYRYRQGTTTSGWGSPGYNFSTDPGTDTPLGMAIEKIGAQIIAVSASFYADEIVRYRSTDGGTTWATDTLISGYPNGTGATALPRWGWPKITETDGSSFKLYWHARKSGYTTPSATGLDVSGEGVSSLYLAELSALAITSWTANVTVSVVVVAKTWTANVTVLAAATETWTANVQIATTSTTVVTRPFTAPFYGTEPQYATFYGTEPVTAPFDMDVEI